MLRWAFIFLFFSISHKCSEIFVANKGIVESFFECHLTQHVEDFSERLEEVGEKVLGLVAVISVEFLGRRYVDPSRWYPR